MPKVEPFELHAEGYDAWFDEHVPAYLSELEAVRALLPPGAEGLEVGVGTGRFAGPLGIRTGVEPSGAMASIARRRGVDVRSGVAEALPCSDESFDFVLMVTVLCFLDDPRAALREARRVLRPGGSVVIAFIDAESRLGREYAREPRGVFFREAVFYTPAELTSLLEGAGFEALEFRQTLFGAPDTMQAPDEATPGYGEGSFVVVRASVTSHP